MRCVIVTGVSRGLGAALARVLLDREAVVLGVGRSSAAGLEGERYRFASCDLADVAGIDAALAPAFGALSGLSPRSVCLVNNAATVEPSVNPASHHGRWRGSRHRASNATPRKIRQISIKITGT